MGRYNLSYSDNVRFDTDPAFWNLITRTFAPEYVNRCLRSEEDSIDYRNWTARLYLLWLSFSASAK